MTPPTQHDVLTREQTIQMATQAGFKTDGGFVESKFYHCDITDELQRFAALLAAHIHPTPQDSQDVQRVWIAFNSADDDEPVMFFTELPGKDLKERFVLKEYVCYPVGETA